MELPEVSEFVKDLLIILSAGLVAGIVCRKLKLSLLIGYLVVGSVIGVGGLNWIPAEDHQMELLAETGALFLLFAVGIEFSRSELAKLGKFLVTAGPVQMLAVAIPLTLMARWMGLEWNAAVLAGCAGALSSTVLVFRALIEIGQTATPHGLRALGVLLFQDIALVPLLLLVPLLIGGGDPPTVLDYVELGLKSLLFIATVVIVRSFMHRFVIAMMAELRSVEIVVLFALCVLGGTCWGAYLLGLPPAIGALAAGVTLSGTRLTKQIDTILLPYRETFAAVFFVTLGTLLRPAAFLYEPVLLTLGVVGMLTLKTCGAALALRVSGLNWKAAFGMGLGLAQLGEFSFLLVSKGVSEGIISHEDYNRMLFIALGTLILTPLLLKFGLQWTNVDGVVVNDKIRSKTERGDRRRAVVIGIGPIGRQLANRLNNLGVELVLVDLSPINLHPFAQQGISTLAGDARDASVLEKALIDESGLVVIAIPTDDLALQVLRNVRKVNRTVKVLVRCRFEACISQLISAGASQVVSEEQEASGPLLRWCEQHFETLEQETVKS
ncbi:MAG: cation:proton antiporter [Planctomycetes bacterium]|nr:cation:proton antiporter [Planctomycetota bacterium]